MSTYPKSENTRRHIFETAWTLFLEKGYFSTPLTDIAKAADVSTGTVYRFFPSKSDFLFEKKRLSQKHLRELAVQLPDDMPIVDKICTIASADLVTNYEHINLSAADDGNSNPQIELALALRSEPYKTPSHLKREEGYRQELRSIYRMVLEAEQEMGRLRPEFDIEEACKIIVALYLESADRNIMDGNLDIAAKMKPSLEVVFSWAITDAENRREHQN